MFKMDVKKTKFAEEKAYCECCNSFIANSKVSHTRHSNTPKHKNNHSGKARHLRTAKHQKYVNSNEYIPNAPLFFFFAFFFRRKVLRVDLLFLTKLFQLNIYHQFL